MIHFTPSQAIQMQLFSKQHPVVSSPNPDRNGLSRLLSHKTSSQLPKPHDDRPGVTGGLASDKPTWHMMEMKDEDDGLDSSFHLNSLEACNKVIDLAHARLIILVQDWVASDGRSQCHGRRVAGEIVQTALRIFSLLSP